MIPLIRDLPMPSAIPLGDAMLCLDCDTVCNIRMCRACPNCASVHRMPIATFLDRTP